MNIDKYQGKQENLDFTFLYYVLVNPSMERDSLGCHNVSGEKPGPGPGKRNPKLSNSELFKLNFYNSFPWTEGKLLKLTKENLCYISTCFVCLYLSCVLSSSYFKGDFVLTVLLSSFRNDVLWAGFFYDFETGEKG